jgi:DNA-binding MarR family transcriptional regulator
MKDKVAHLEDHIGFWLNRITQEVHFAFVEKLKEAKISISEWCVLISLYHQRQPNPAQIAHQVGIDRAAISRTVEKLVQRGFIRREIGQDRRYTILELSEGAKKLVPKLAAMADANELEFFYMLSDVEKEQLEKILLKIAHHIGVNTEKK